MIKLNDVILSLIVLPTAFAHAENWIIFNRECVAIDKAPQWAKDPKRCVHLYSFADMGIDVKECDLTDHVGEASNKHQIMFVNDKLNCYRFMVMALELEARQGNHHGRENEDH